MHEIDFMVLRSRRRAVECTDSLAVFIFSGTAMNISAQLHVHNFEKRLIACLGLHVHERKLKNCAISCVSLIISTDA